MLTSPTLVSSQEGQAIGDQIRAMRELRGLSLNKLSQLSKGAITQSALSRIEAGRSTYPSVTTLQTLARLLDCTFVIEGDRIHIAELD